GGIEIDHDLSVLAACRRGKGDATHGRQLLAQAVDAVVVELLLVERVRGQADLQDGNAGGIKLHDDRRLNARRQEHANVVGGRYDLRDGQVEINVRLEEDLLNRQSIEGLRLHVLDAVDVGAHGVL